MGTSFCHITVAQERKGEKEQEGTVEGTGVSMEEAASTADGGGWKRRMEEGTPHSGSSMEPGQSHHVQTRASSPFGH